MSERTQRPDSDGTPHSNLRALLGLQDGAFDNALRKHRRRLLDRAGVLVAFLGLAFLGIAMFQGDLGYLHTGDWITAGSVFVAAGGLFLSLGDGS